MMKELGSFFKKKHSLSRNTTKIIKNRLFKFPEYSSVIDCNEQWAAAGGASPASSLVSQILLLFNSHYAIKIE